MAEEGYGKRPLWQWILVYVIIGGIAYFLIYKFVIAKNGSYNGGGSNYNPPSVISSPASNTTQPQVTTQPQAPSKSIPGY